MAYKINELAAEQVQEIAHRFPASEPKPFHLVEEDKLQDHPMILGYYDIKPEAEKALEQWAARDDLQDDIIEFTDTMLEKYGDRLSEKEIRQMIKE